MPASNAEMNKSAPGTKRRSQGDMVACSPTRGARIQSSRPRGSTTLTFATDMTPRPPRRLTGHPDVDARLVDLLQATGAQENADQLLEILASAAGLAVDGADRLDLKITNAAVKEMREAFRVFAPYRDVPKVTIFGSARTLPEDPLYSQTRDFAAAAAAAGWMVVTGAGPGIMAAAAEGAGQERSI